ncbi:MAG TPA: dephospho-CoA kinase [Bryobacteraceae bacterium]|nr:dephospho-CoA kinase [Bryobacteraceae bacterium]
MLKVALTGGLASGKTFVGATLQNLGCLLIQADRLGHEVLLPSGEVYRDVIRHFGGAILDNEGLIDRRRLAAQVFEDAERLALLNSLIHPPVRLRVEELMKVFFADQPEGIAIVEAAIHIETGGYKDYDLLVLAWCRQEQQVERAMKRDQTTREEVLARLKRQMPLDEKQKYARYIIDTSGTKEETVRQAEFLYKELRSRS